MSSVENNTLPQGWRLMSLKDKEVCELIMGQSPSSDTYNIEGKGLPFFQGKKEFGKVSPIAEKYCTEPMKIASPGDILMSVRAPVGPTNIANVVCCIGRGLAAVRPNLNFTLKNYLLYYFKNFEVEFSKKGKGSTFSAITKSALEESIIPIPPLKEQKRIVAKIDTLFAKIDKAISLTEESLKQAKNLLPSVLKEVFEKGKADGWEEKEFGEVITILTDYHANGSYKVLKKNVELKDIEDYAWMIRSTDFEKKFKNSLKYIDKHAYDFMSKSQVYGNEIIMSKIGNAGIVYLMPSIDRPVSLAMNLFLIRLNENIVLPDFIFRFLKSNDGETQIKKRLKGATTKTITKDNVRNIIISYPNLKEQKKNSQKTK